jgi:hypothetical protein
MTMKDAIELRAEGGLGIVPARVRSNSFVIASSVLGSPAAIIDAPCCRRIATLKTQFGSARFAATLTGIDRQAYSGEPGTTPAWD